MQRLTTKLFGVVAASLMMLLLAAPGFAQVAVNVANSVDATAGSSGAVGVNVGPLDGEGVLGYEFTVEYDPSVINITGVNASGTISDGISIESNGPTDSTFTVAAATGVALEGSGTLIWLTYEGVSTGTSSLELTDFTFNEGSPVATNAGVALRLPNTGAEPDSSFILPIFTSDIGGEGVLGYEFTVTFDPSIVVFDGVVTNGTISENAVVEFNAGTGTISVAAAQGTAFENGNNGVLIYLQGSSMDVEGMTSALTFTNVQMNEGDPTAVGIDGSITVGVGLDNEKPVELPGSFVLHGNYPNPFNPSTTIRFDLPATAEVSVQVFDILGRPIMTLPSRTMQAGTDLNMEVNASTLASGTYLYRLTARTASNTLIETGQMMLVK